MKILCELNDRIVLGLDGLSDKPPRHTARAIVKNREGLYAVMYADKFHLYSLPGGGVEPSETVRDALLREVWEETGCTCDEIAELGIVCENRACHDFPQESHYFVVKTYGPSDQTHLTEAECASGTGVQWHSFKEMYRLITDPVQDTQQRKYIQARDKAALNAYAAERGEQL